MLAALFAPLLLALPVVQGPSPEDLTEAGDVLRFSPAPWGLEIRIAGDPWLDRPAFSLKGRPGRRLLCRLPDLPPDWSVRAWVGPGRWRPLSAAPAPGGGIEFHVLFRRSREVIELIPPQPAGAPRAGSYSWSRFQAWIQSLPPDPRLSITTLGASVEGRSVYRLLFDDPQSKAPPAWKRTFLVLVRQHGDEWASSYVLEGMVDLLLGRGTTTPPLGLTRYTRWVIYPLVNPDGAFHDQRWNANGVDLNRDWSPTGPWAGQQPETWLLQSDIAGLPWLPAIRAGGDHHGWSRGTDGGYRHGLLMPPALVAEPLGQLGVQLFGLEWLGAVVAYPAGGDALIPHRLTLRGDENNRDVAGLRIVVQCLAHLEAVHFRHDEVHEDRVRVDLRGHLHPTPAVVGHVDLVSRRLADHLDQLQDGGAIVDAQDTGGSQDHSFHRHTPEAWRMTYWFVSLGNRSPAPYRRGGPLPFSHS